MMTGANAGGFPRLGFPAKIALRLFEPSDRNLTDDEPSTGGWTEGSPPFRSRRVETVKRIVYPSQTGDRTFMGWGAMKSGSVALFVT
jgi:hypothetical protein